MEVISLSKMMRLTLPKSLSELGAARRDGCHAGAVSASGAWRRSAPPPQGVSRGENFSAKPPAQLFASDCTGAGCHKGPQGLGKKANGIGGLAGFLREHYTNSRESAAALANYLSGQPSGARRREREPKEARQPQTGQARDRRGAGLGHAELVRADSPRGQARLGRARASRIRSGTRTPPGRGPAHGGQA